MDRERAISGKKKAQSQVRVSFDFYSESESFNVLVALSVLKTNEVSGWKRYNHTATIKTDSSGEVWIAVGISISWETKMAYNLDNKN